MTNTTTATGIIPKITSSDTLASSLEVLVVLNPGDVVARRLCYATVQDLTSSKSKVLPVDKGIFSSPTYDGDYTMVIPYSELFGIQQDLDPVWAATLPDLSVIGLSFTNSNSDNIFAEYYRIFDSAGLVSYKYQRISLSDGMTFHRYTYANITGDEIWSSWQICEKYNFGDVIYKLIKQSDLGKNKGGFISLTTDSKGNVLYLNKFEYPDTYAYIQSLDLECDFEGDARLFYLPSVDKDNLTQVFGNESSVILVPCMYVGYPSEIDS